MKRRTLRAIKQGSSTVLAMTCFLDVGKEYVVREIFDGNKSFIVITEAIPEQSVPSSILRSV